jgi:tagatose-1,6-bisphosphate aldolase
MSVPPRAHPHNAELTLDALARESGTFLMVAMDQRESLRTMLEERHGAPVTDERLAAFKLSVARELSPSASALLVDSEYGWFDRIVGEGLVAPSCGLILAVDALQQEPGQIVEDTELDGSVDVAAAARAGVVALKLLVIWRDDEQRQRRLELSRRFVELAAAHGLLSVLEPVVRGPEGFDKEAAIVEAARELGVHGAEFRRDPAGVWIGEAKVAACGIHVARGVSVHGYALNVDTPDEAWRRIKPCGLSVPQVSLARARGAQIDVAEVAAIVGPKVGFALA